jgi:putative transposase
LRTEPLKALVIGAFVRGLSMRDVESLCKKAGLGKLSKSSASRICTELRERFEQFKRRDLYDVDLAALFLDAVFLSVRPDGPKEGVLVAWGFTERDDKQRLKALVGELDKAGYTAAAKCLTDDLDALVVHLRYPLRHRRRWRSTNLLERSLARSSAARR